MTEQIPIRADILHEGPDGTRLIGGKCDSCGQVFFPNAEFCLACGHENLTETLLSEKGSLHSFTVVHMPASGFPPPFAIGYIDIEQGVRIFSQLCMDEENPFQTGMEMKLETGTLWCEEDKDIIGYRFSPV